MALAKCLLLLALVAAAAAAPPSLDALSEGLQELGWKVSSSDSNGTRVLYTSKLVSLEGKRSVVAASVALTEHDGEPTLAFRGATATARSAFVEDAGAVLAQLGGGAVDAPADLGATGSRRLLATCDSRCPIWTCSYREKVVVNFGCFKLWGNPASFGYQVRYRKGRSGGAPTGRYPCNNPTWYSNYKGGMATCPTCQTSTYTMLDCNWP